MCPVQLHAGRSFFKRIVCVTCDRIDCDRDPSVASRNWNLDLLKGKNNGDDGENKPI